MTRERHIPESRIALNPVVIDDSKRGGVPDDHTPDCFYYRHGVCPKPFPPSFPPLEIQPKKTIHGTWVATSESDKPPLDEHALITRLMEWEIKAHLNAVKHSGYTKGLEHAAEEKAYGRVIRLIQEGRGVRK